MTRRVPELWVERLARGELPAHQAAEVRRRLEAEPGGLARLEAIAASDAEILAALPPERVAREVRARLAEAGAGQARRGRRLAAWAPAVAIAAAALLLVGRPTSEPTPEPVDDLRAKGDLGPRIFVHRRALGGDDLLVDGAEARPGDELQLGYAANGWTHGALLSVDGHGAVTLHHPVSPGDSTRLGAPGEVLLRRAYVLDDAPAHETFVFVVSRAPLDVVSLTAQLRDGGVDAELVGQDGQPLEAVTLTLRKAP